MGQRERSGMGAALAYYTAFSIAPLLVIALSIAEIFYRAIVCPTSTATSRAWSEKTRPPF